MRLALTFLTESRADWGGLYPVIREAHRRWHFCRTVCTGEHRFRLTDEQVKIDLASISKDLVDEVYFETFPIFALNSFDYDTDWLICLGDRQNVLRAIIDAYTEVGIAHLSGGDRQDGLLIDEPCRHAISKFAHIHFPCLQSSADRLIRHGEDQNRIHCVGSTLVDDLVDFDPGEYHGEEYYLVQMHPAPNWENDLRKIIDTLANENLVIMQPNSDESLTFFMRKIKLQTNLPRNEFLMLLYHAKCFIGNSSALFLEAQYLGVPCLRIGERNSNREPAFYDPPVGIENLGRIQEFDFRSDTGLRNGGKHGDGTASKKIIDTLENIGVPTKEFLRKIWI